MKAFKLFKTYYSYIENKVVKEPYWTEALKKDLVKLLDDAETKMKKENVSYMRINDTTLYEHTEYNGVVLDFTFTIEEVTIQKRKTHYLKKQWANQVKRKTNNFDYL